jgi:hypothetical protein
MDLMRKNILAGTALASEKNRRVAGGGALGLFQQALGHRIVRFEQGNEIVSRARYRTIEIFVFFVHRRPLIQMSVPVFKPDNVDAKTAGAAEQFGTNRTSKQLKKWSWAVPGNENSADVRLSRETQHLADHVGRFEPYDFCAQVAGEDGVVDECANSSISESAARRIGHDRVKLAAILARGGRGLAHELTVTRTVRSQTGHHRCLCATAWVTGNQAEIRLSNRIGA